MIYSECHQVNLQIMLSLCGTILFWELLFYVIFGLYFAINTQTAVIQTITSIFD